MSIYIFGLALLLAGSFIFNKSMGLLDNTPALMGMQALGNLAGLACFIAGFFVFDWWAPVVSLFLSMIVVQVLNIALAPSQNSSSTLFEFRSHLAILLGSFICLYGLLS